MIGEISVFNTRFAFDFGIGAAPRRKEKINKG